MGGKSIAVVNIVLMQLHPSRLLGLSALARVLFPLLLGSTLGARLGHRFRRGEPPILKDIKAAHAASDVYTLKGLCGQVLHAAWAEYHDKPCGYDMHKRITLFAQAKEFCDSESVEPNFDKSFEELNAQLCSTCGADCKADCKNGGKCVCLPKEYPAGGCACPPDWTGSTCEVPKCDLVGNCGEKGKCVAPQKCECTDGYWGKGCQNAPTTTFTTTTTTSEEAKVPCLMGKDCDPEQCLKCVDAKGHWCLKDAVCSNEPPSSDQCPKSSKYPESLIVHEHPDPCYEKYHDCVKLAGEVSMEANAEGGLCTEKGKKAYKAFDEALPDCKDFFIGGYQRPIGYLIINRPYTEIHDSLDNLHAECK